MRSTDTLRQEHEHILQALSVLDALVDRAARSEPAPQADARALLAFFRDFADRSHHAKEENALFPALEARGLPRRGGPIGVMLAEHDEGRALLRALADTAALGEGEAARANFAGAARAYTSLLRAHIQKENEILFRMAERVLDVAEDERITSLFAEADAAALPPGERDRLLASVASLACTYR
jgi:hemerythrin-like domain-containing protein